ncbi:MAG: 3-oxoacyl-[acyl-carrier-protein] reductase [Candidatus Omnitrophota bacterium]
MLKNKVAIVTGGTRGIGRAIVLALVKEGVKVAFNYVKSDKESRELLKEVDSLGSEALSHKFDVRNFNSAKEFVEKVREYFGSLDILINNAGILKDRALMMMDESDWHDVIDTNLTGYYNLARVCIVGFMKQKSGNIVNIASSAGISGTARQTNYSASKAGIIGFTKALAKEVAPYNIRVNAVAPGFIETDMVQLLKDDYKAKLKTLIPKGEFGKPQDIANTVLFLLSDASGYITGQVLRVDGGMILQ